MLEFELNTINHGAGCVLDIVDFGMGLSYMD